MSAAKSPAPRVFPLAGRRVWVAGHGGMVGSAIVRRLQQERCDVITVSRREVDLRRQEQTEAWIAAAKPDAIFLAAATVGGIYANDTRPADFIYDNTVVAANVIHAAHRVGVKKLLFLGSSCIYPKHATQPMREEDLLTGALEPTNQWYAVAKILGVKLCQAYRKQHGRDFISAMPTNLYGPHDTFDLMGSHVLPALMLKAHLAKVGSQRTLPVWGTGTPRREFLYVDDLADALVFLMERYSDESHVNVGTGTDVTIREAAELVRSVVGFDGPLAFDASKPDGTPRKLLDVSRLAGLGWTASTPLKDGLRATYQWFVANGVPRATGVA